MRDPNRIKTVLEVVEHYWEQNPDMRLGQLLLNVARDPALYYMEDEDLICHVIGLYERGGGDREATRALIKRWTGDDVTFADEVEDTEDTNN